MKQLILLQGAPGSGKSTVAEILRKANSGTNNCEIHSADNYWYRMVGDDPNKYSYDPELSGKNHVWNQRNVMSAMTRGVWVIIVDNTNTLRSEAVPYIAMAEFWGYEIQVVRVDPGVEVCVARNAERTEDRRVPEDVVRAMHARMENLIK